MIGLIWILAVIGTLAAFRSLPLLTGLCFALIIALVIHDWMKVKQWEIDTHKKIRELQKESLELLNKIEEYTKDARAQQ